MVGAEFAPLQRSNLLRWPSAPPLRLFKNVSCSRPLALATRTRSAASSSHTRPRFTPTATECSARCPTPRTPCGRRSCARGAAVRFRGPELAAWWRGRDTIAAFAKEAVEVCAESRTVPTHANGQPAVAYYRLDGATGRYAAAAIDVLTLEGARVKEITAFMTPALFPRFGLPPELTP
jgi:hypothetical protein